MFICTRFPSSQVPELGFKFRFVWLRNSLFVCLFVCFFLSFFLDPKGFIYLFIKYNLSSNWFPYNTQGSSQQVPSWMPITHLPLSPSHQPSVCSQYLRIFYGLLPSLSVIFSPLLLPHGLLLSFSRSTYEWKPKETHSFNARAENLKLPVMDIITNAGSIHQALTICQELYNSVSMVTHWLLLQLHELCKILSLMLQMRTPSWKTLVYYLPYLTELRIDGDWIQPGSLAWGSPNLTLIEYSWK